MVAMSATQDRSLRLHVAIQRLIGDSADEQSLTLRFRAGSSATLHSPLHHVSGTKTCATCIRR